MMRNPTKLIGIVAALTAIGFYACSKYKDPPNADPADTGRHYCNDSRAVNFNWGFPGTPDNDSCVYPVDSMLGNWVFTDSVFLPNGNFQDVFTRNLTFTSTEDTTLTHMAVSGWCAGAPIAITATKYGLAYVDTLLDGSPGQLLCTTTDTLSGTFKKTEGIKDTLNISLTLSNTTGTTLHKGTAWRQ